MGNTKFWHIWSAYAMYYFGRVNLSIVIPVLLATYGLSKYHLGLVASGFFFAYAAGQFLHGQISERFNPITYLAIGLIGSATMNLLLGFSFGFFWILFIGEIMDGGFQSMGWSSAVRANAELSKKNNKNLKRSSCILGTSYQIGNSATWLISSLVVGLFGWQGGFWVASGFMFIRGITLLSLSPIIPVKQIKKEPIFTQLRKVLTLPIVVAGIAMAFLNIIRYGVIVWIPTYLIEVQGSSIIRTGLKIFLIPIAGVIGTLAYNKLKVERHFLTMIFLSFLGIVFAFYGFLTGMISIILLILSGFFIYGPHVFLVSTFPSKFIDQKKVAATTGFIDGMAYVGAILVGLLVPFILDITNNNWNIVFASWSISCLIVISLIAFLYLFAKFDGKTAKEIDILNNKNNQL